MIHFGGIFTELLNQSDFTLEEIAQKIGCNVPNIYKLKKKPLVDSEMLEKVCRAFGVSPLIFFDPDVANNKIPEGITNYYNKAILGKATMTVGTSIDNAYLKKLLEEKDKNIAEKERLIQILMAGIPGLGSAQSADV